MLVVPTFWTLKFKLVGLKLAPDAGVTPAPLSGRFWGLSTALSVMLTLALRLPSAPGVKVTEIVQDALMASVLGLAGQVVVWAKSPALLPVSAMLLMFKVAVPVLVSVTV